MEEKIQELADLFSETQKAHHRAYFDTDGFDPEWPIWYADYLLPKLPSFFETEMTKSELIYLMVHLSRIQPAEAPDESWSRYYARYMIEHYK